MLVGRIERGLEYHLVETVTLFRHERNRYMFGMYGIESSAEYRCLHIYDYTISARDIQRIRRMKARSRGNILLMAKFIDKIIFSAAFIVVVYGLSSRYIGETFALALTAAAYVSAALVYLASRVRRDLAKEITPQEMCSYLALMGAEKQTKLLYQTLPEARRVQLKPPYFVFEKDGEKYMVAALYKFLNLAQEDISAAYRAANGFGVKKIVVLTRARDRKTVNLGALIPMDISYPDKRAVYRYLKKHNALPKPRCEKKRVRNVRPEPGAILDTVFAPNKLKYYLFVAIMLTVAAFFTPIKTYYYVCAAIPLALASGCLIRSAHERR